MNKDAAEYRRDQAKGRASKTLIHYIGHSWNKGELDSVNRAELRGFVDDIVDAAAAQAVINTLDAKKAEPKSEEEIEKAMEADGWEIECESPLEIRHSDGSFASLNAARIVMDSYR